MKNVIKRDGRIVPFNALKIVNAVHAAMQETGKVDLDLASNIAAKITLLNEDHTVEEIQDMVEHALMESERKDVAKQYILYRAERTKQRNREANERFNSIVNAEANDITRENANMNADTPAGMMMKFASETSKTYSVDCLIAEDDYKWVRANKLHIHDMDYYPTKSLTCIQHPLNKILSNGFRAGHGASRPAKRIETASILGCISMESIQNEFAFVP